MKKNLFYLFALICSMGLFTACSDDDDDKSCPVPQTEFTAANGLKLNYNGEQMLGKKVTFTPDASDPTKATLILSGNLDLSGALTSKADNQSIVAGVLPGSPVVTLPVTLKIQNGECSFDGTSETTYCTFSYAGKVSTTEMQLDLTNVTLKNSALAGTTWVPNPFDPYEDDQTPIHLVWDAEKKATIEIFPGYESEMPISFIINMAMHMDLIDMGEGEKTTVPAMLCNVLKSITLGADGNISASYVDAAQGGTEAVNTPANVAQYVLLDDSHMKVYLNLDAILASVAKAASINTKGVDMGTVLAQAMEVLLPLVTDGVPLTYVKSEGKLTAYLDTELLLPILKGIVAPMFADEEFVAGLIEMMKADPDFGSMAGMAEGLLKSLSEIINTTSRVEIGLKLNAQ